LWVPIVVNNQGVVLDGHHRFKACQELGIEEPKTTTMEFKYKLEEKLFVIDCNLRRRQLNDFQKTELALKSKSILEQVAKQNSQANLKQNQDGSPSSKSLELGDKGVSEEIGKRAGVSHETVRKVETLIHKAPERVLLYNRNNTDKDNLKLKLQKKKFGR
jgi:hypothetical protein